MRQFSPWRWRTGLCECVLGAALMIGLAGCALPRGDLEPVAATAPGINKVEMLVATTRMRSTPAEMFSGDRGPGLDFADIVVSIPPDSVRQIGEVQKPVSFPAIRQSIS